MYERLGAKELEKLFMARLTSIVEPVNKIITDSRQKIPPMLREMLKLTRSMKYEEEKKYKLHDNISCFLFRV